MNQYPCNVIPNYPLQNMVAFYHITIHILSILTILIHKNQQIGSVYLKLSLLNEYKLNFSYFAI